MDDRVIGILGGMGPEATLDFYRHIINLTPANVDQEHIRVLIFSNPKIPDRTMAIAGDGESPLPSLIESAQLLEKGGAGIIAMPCNTAHHYLPEIRRKLRIPIIDMIEETCKKLAEDLPGAMTAGLLAATGTVKSGVYSRALATMRIRLLLPNEADQDEIQSAIAQVKAGTHNRFTQETFQAAGTRLMKAGAKAVILGCTEILAEAAVDWALGRRC
jgi:aspartate racemase